jgi:hypothetical protein
MALTDWLLSQGKAGIPHRTVDHILFPPGCDFYPPANHSLGFDSETGLLNKMVKKYDSL